MQRSCNSVATTTLLSPITGRNLRIEKTLGAVLILSPIDRILKLATRRRRPNARSPPQTRAESSSCYSVRSSSASSPHCSLSRMMVNSLSHRSPSVYSLAKETELTLLHLTSTKAPRMKTDPPCPQWSPVGVHSERTDAGP